MQLLTFTTVGMKELLLEIRCLQPILAGGLGMNLPGWGYQSWGSYGYDADQQRSHDVEK
jgi:hypothetical protein